MKKKILSIRRSLAKFNDCPAEYSGETGRNAEMRINDNNRDGLKILSEERVTINITYNYLNFSIARKIHFLLTSNIFFDKNWIYSYKI